MVLVHNKQKWQEKTERDEDTTKRGSVKPWESKKLQILITTDEYD